MTREKLTGRLSWFQSHHIFTFSWILGANSQVFFLECSKSSHPKILLPLNNFRFDSFKQFNFEFPDLISAWLAQSLSNEDNETLLLSFILARHLSHSCPPSPYANWFRKSFGHRQTTLCKTEQQFKFLLQFLIRLVPHEPRACLKVHHELVNWLFWWFPSLIHIFTATLCTCKHERNIEWFSHDCLVKTERFDACLWFGHFPSRLWNWLYCEFAKQILWQ